jgi:uncharacterized protein (TIGR02453 family)
MKSEKAIFTAETFRFFRELKRNNSKTWMDENRHRYKTHVVEPLRRLLDELTLPAQKLHAGFSLSGRTGENFSRINRDTRFANDKTPYYTHMYLYLRCEEALGRSGGQLYVGISAEGATAGLRMYRESRESAMACICLPRAMENLPWLDAQRKKFVRKYDCYWYASEKGTWTKKRGWPRDTKEWKKAKGWIVRKRFPASTTLRSTFPREVEKIFRELFPLYAFSSLRQWRP